MLVTVPVMLFVIATLAVTYVNALVNVIHAIGQGAGVAWVGLAALLAIALAVVGTVMYFWPDPED